MSKPIEHATPRAKPKVNYGLWVIMLCQCRFTLGDSISLWSVVWTMGEAVGGGAGEGAHGKSLHLALGFVVKLKLLLKNEIIFKKSSSCMFIIYCLEINKIFKKLGNP